MSRVSTQGERGAGFAPDDENRRWRFTGALTYSTAGSVLESAASLALPSSGEVDLGSADPVDSAAVAVLIALERRAAAEGRTLRFTHTPAALPVLADLYGVDDILAS
jgi:ABC-type transporter Mla MlaB component